MKLPWWLPFGRVPKVSASELSQLLAGSDPQLIDVRTPLEFSAGHIRGAINIPIYELPGRLASLKLDPARPIVAVCATAHRSPPAIRQLHGAGYKNAVQLKNGMLAWVVARLPTIQE